VISNQDALQFATAFCAIPLQSDCDTVRPLKNKNRRATTTVFNSESHQELTGKNEMRSLYSSSFDAPLIRR
jgi:hypothetical protein